MTLAEKIKMLEYHTNVMDVDKVIEEVNVALTKKLGERFVERQDRDNMAIASMKATSTASGKTLPIINEMRYMNNTDKINYLKTKVLPLLNVNAELKSLKVLLGTTEKDLKETFDPDTFTYNWEISSSSQVTNAKVTPTAIGSTATLKYKIGSGSKTSTTSGTAISLGTLAAASTTTVLVEVTENDVTNTYTLTVKVVAPAA